MEVVILTMTIKLKERRAKKSNISEKKLPSASIEILHIYNRSNWNRQGHYSVFQKTIKSLSQTITFTSNYFHNHWEVKGLNVFRYFRGIEYNQFYLQLTLLLPLTCIPLNSLFLLCEGNCGILTHIVATRLQNLISLVGTASHVCGIIK